MSLHEAIDNLIDAAASGNTLVMEKAVAAVRAAQAADSGAPEVEAPEVEAPEVEAPEVDAPEADAPEA